MKRSLLVLAAALLLAFAGPSISPRPARADERDTSGCVRHFFDDALDCYTRVSNSRSAQERPVESQRRLNVCLDAAVEGLLDCRKNSK
jgi:hypothetical protein